MGGQRLFMTIFLDQKEEVQLVDSRANDLPAIKCCFENNRRFEIVN